MSLSKAQLEKIESELSEVLTFTQAGWPVIDPDGMCSFTLEHAKDLFEVLRMAQSVAQDSMADVEADERYE